MSRFHVVHTTVYRYQSTVSASYGQVCLLPREQRGQRCWSSSLTITPRPADTRERRDVFGNRVGYFEIDRPHTTLSISARSEVEIARNRDEISLGATMSLAAAQRAVQGLEGQLGVEAAQFLLDSPRTSADSAIRDYAQPSFADDRPVVECLGDLMARINADFDFEVGATQVTSTAADLLSSGGGVCQDFAHLAIAAIRANGLPARYVSGYLETDPPPGRPRLAGADVSHAWASAKVPGFGWIDLDPTNNQFVDERYVTVAWGRDYTDIAPVKGVIYSRGGMTELDVSVDVTRVEGAEA